MAALVVHVLEVVEVEEDERDGMPVPVLLSEETGKVLVERALVRETRERVAPRFRVRQREASFARERLRGEVGDCGDDFRVAFGLNARRQRDQDGSERLPVRDERGGDRLAARRAQ